MSFLSAPMLVLLVLAMLVLVRTLILCFKAKRKPDQVCPTYHNF